MKAVINEVKFLREYQSKFGGTMYVFSVRYGDTIASYTSTSKNQTKFVAGQEAEFVEEPKTGTDKHGNPYEFTAIKPMTSVKQSNFGRAIKKEQSRYSGFAMAYAKDLVVAGKIDLNGMLRYAEDMFHFMVKLDKTLEE